MAYTLIVRRYKDEELVDTRTVEAVTVTDAFAQAERLSFQTLFYGKGRVEFSIILVDDDAA